MNRCDEPLANMFLLLEMASRDGMNGEEASRRAGCVGFAIRVERQRKDSLLKWRGTLARSAE